MNRTDLRGRSALITSALLALPLLTGLLLLRMGEPDPAVESTTSRATVAALGEAPKPPAPSPSVPDPKLTPADEEPAVSDLDVAFTEESEGYPLEALSERSLLLVLDVTAREVTLAEVVSKDMAYRRLEQRAPGPYLYLLEDAGGSVLHCGRFEVPDLCPLVGVEHIEEHLSGHVALDHRGVALVRVPDLPGAARVVFCRAIPDLDRDLRSLGSVDLPQRS